MSLSNEAAASAVAGAADTAGVQQDLATAVRSFAERATAQEETGAGKLAAFAPDAVTATEALIAVSAILKAVNVQVFELGMWQSFNGK